MRELFDLSPTRYYQLLNDRTALQLQLQGFAASGDPEVREAVRNCFDAMWTTVSETTGLDAVTVKTFLAFGMLLDVGAALDVLDVDAPWADGNVGMYGKSYDGETQVSVAGLGDPEKTKYLKAIVPIASVAGQYEYSNMDGVPFAGQAALALERARARTAENDARDEAEDSWGKR